MTMAIELSRNISFCISAAVSAAAAASAAHCQTPKGFNLIHLTLFSNSFRLTHDTKGK